MIDSSSSLFLYTSEIVLHNISCSLVFSDFSLNCWPCWPYCFVQITGICTTTARAQSGTLCAEAAANMTWSAANAPCRGPQWATRCPAAATPSMSVTPASSIQVQLQPNRQNNLGKIYICWNVVSLHSVCLVLWPHCACGPVRFRHKIAWLRFGKVCFLHYLDLLPLTQLEYALKSH